MKFQEDNKNMNIRKIEYFFAILFFSFSAYAETTEITIYVDKAYRPYSYFADGKSQGLYIDILRTAASKMEGFEVLFQPVPWNRGKKMMENGQGLALAPAYFHAHDWSYLYPYSIPLYEETVVLYCKESYAPQGDGEWPSDFEGAVVGNMTGFDGWGGRKFRTMVANKQISYHEVNDAEALIMMAASGRNDCILMEEFAFRYHNKRLMKDGKFDNTKHLALQKMAIVGVDYGYVGYSESAIRSGNYPQHYQFRKLLDSTIYQMKKSGEIEEIIVSYWK